MKITDVRVTRYRLGKLDRPRRNSILVSRNRGVEFVEIDTDEGVSGVSIGAGGGRAEAFISRLRERLLGENPMDAARVWHHMFTGWRKPIVKGDAIMSIGGVDNALWDLRGKVLGMPVYRLL
ncbi:MAG: hypothetical protein ACRDP8_01170, partial [Actinopolymorphaceae bacterium]